MKFNIKDDNDEVIVRVLQKNGLSLNPGGKSKNRMRIRVVDQGESVVNESLSKGIVLRRNAPLQLKKSNFLRRKKSK